MGIRDQASNLMQRGRQFVEGLESFESRFERHEDKAARIAMERRHAVEEMRQASADRFPETVEAFGGRVALVTNFGWAPGESGPKQIGANIAGALAGKGFDVADRITVDALVSWGGIRGRQGQFDQDRQLIIDGLRGRVPASEYSTNTGFLEEEEGLTLGILGRRLEEDLKFRDERRPGMELGFVAVVSAIEIAHAYREFNANGATYTEEVYEAVRYGGVLMPNDTNTGWDQVLPGNQFAGLPEALKEKSRAEAAS